MRASLLATCVMLVVVMGVTVHALDNGLGRTPQMGWNSWNHFGCNLHETLVRQTAESVVNLGLAAVGYQYVNLDDCWALSRDNTSRVVPDPSAFPSGMFALGEYIHSLGLKFGIYSDAGTATCAGRPGSLGYEAIDALTYAAWGVDYLKYDNCNNNNIDPKVRYPIMRDALNWTGRPIFFSLCEWGVENPATWATSVGNSWRTTNDISDSWDSLSGNADQNDAWASYAGPGQWNDPDMLEVGNGGLTHDEEVAHFSWWAVMKAPLIIGADLTSIKNDSLQVLLNTEVIAINQDPLGVQASRLSSVNLGETWAGPLADGSYAVFLVNRDGSNNVSVSANFTLIGLGPTEKVAVRDLWLHEDMGVFQGNYTVTLGPLASATLKLTPAQMKREVEWM